jgi:hypothetical protein
MERAAFRKKQRRLDVWRLIFVDEFGVHRAMSRIYARAPRGERARVKEPSAKVANISVISALRLSGVGATMMIEGAVDTQVWDSYIEHFLVPELRTGDIVMLDQISFHGGRQAIGLIKAAGAGVNICRLIRQILIRLKSASPRSREICEVAGRALSLGSSVH